MGIGMRAAVRSQINLMMNAAEHVKQFKGVRDIVYPILWFQVRIVTS
jgi:CD36 family